MEKTTLKNGGAAMMIFILPVIALFLTIWVLWRINKNKYDDDKTSKSDYALCIIFIPLVSFLLGFGFDAIIANALIGFGPEEMTTETYGKQKIFVSIDEEGRESVYFFSKNPNGQLEKKIFSLGETREKKEVNEIQILKSKRELRNPYWEKLYRGVLDKNEKTLILPAGSITSPCNN